MIKWLTKLFRSQKVPDADWIFLNHRKPHWQIESPKDFASFLRALSVLIPEGCVAYLEDGAPSKELDAYLETHTLPSRPKIPGGTFWPNAWYHLPATTDNFSELADIAERHANPEVAIHFHVYRDRSLLLQWYDAFFDPIYVSKEICEKNVKEFCEQLGVQYSEQQGV